MLRAGHRVRGERIAVHAGQFDASLREGLQILVTGRAALSRGPRQTGGVTAGIPPLRHGPVDDLARAGVDVPGEVSVVGYDDSHLSHLMPIGLTTVRQDALLMAEYAVRFAVEHLEKGELTPKEAVRDPKLVVRGTSGPPRSG
ncbi:substrate-binding domain-containing protein [Streptomyces sp. NPDC058695]|uniref:substrate-binding domain-containing protein n=1 Tax=Streptomyces sp. NPDC058695 TaxID=3346604 RepID=UPI003645FEA1